LQNFSKGWISITGNTKSANFCDISSSIAINCSSSTSDLHQLHIASELQSPANNAFGFLDKGRIFSIIVMPEQYICKTKHMSAKIEFESIVKSLSRTQIRRTCTESIFSATPKKYFTYENSQVILLNIVEDGFSLSVEAGFLQLLLEPKLQLPERV
jgi:hypothetical protein